MALGVAGDRLLARQSLAEAPGQVRATILSVKNFPVIIHRRSRPSTDGICSLLRRGTRSVGLPMPRRLEAHGDWCSSADITHLHSSVGHSRTFVVYVLLHAAATRRNFLRAETRCWPDVTPRQRTGLFRYPTSLMACIFGDSEAVRGADKWGFLHLDATNSVLWRQIASLRRPLLGFTAYTHVRFELFFGYVEDSSEYASFYFS